MDLLLTLTMDVLTHRSLSIVVRLYPFIFLAALFIGIQWRSVVLNNMYGSIAKRARCLRQGCFMVVVCLLLCLLPVYVWYKANFPIFAISMIFGLTIIRYIFVIIERKCGIPKDFPFENIKSETSVEMDLWCMKILDDKTKLNKIRRFYLFYSISSIILAAIIIFVLKFLHKLENYSEAINWLKKAADNGETYFYFYLGICYLNLLFEFV